MKPVYAKRNASVAMPGGDQVFVPFGTHWADNDPVVVAHPELFSSDPRDGLYGQPPAEVVEAASAAPGEQRSTRRPSPADLRAGRG